MAKQLTIRLKKTELPIDSNSALQHATNNRDAVHVTLVNLLEQLHQVDGIRLPETTTRFVADFQNNAFQISGTEVIIRPHFKRFMSRRFVDCGAQTAPWICKARNSVGALVNTSAKAEVETFHGNEVTPFVFTIDFDKKTFPDDVPPVEREGISTEFLRSRPIRALKRYFFNINVACLRAAVPVYFDVTTKFLPAGSWPNARRFEPRIVVNVVPRRTWIHSSKYTSRSLLGTGSLKMIPAEYDIPLALTLLKGPVKDAEFTHWTAFSNRAFEIQNGGFTQTTPTADWMTELVFGQEPTPEAVQSGKAPIPPKAEIFTLSTLLERVPEMKRILRSLMKLAKPYDHLSFLPISS